MVYNIGWFVDIESSLHPWDKYYFIMVCNPLNVLLNWFANILLGFFFASLFISDAGL